MKAGSGVLTLGVPTSPGVPPELAALTLTLAYNDVGAGARGCSPRSAREIACVIVEPVAGNMNCIPPVPGFLEALRAAVHAARRAADLRRGDDRLPRRLGGAQELYGVKPDLTTLGKIVGGGMPVGAFGGRATSWTASRRSARCTRPARCPATRWRWPPASRRSRASRRRASTRALAGATDRLVARPRDARASAGVPLRPTPSCGMFGFFFTRRAA